MAENDPKRPADRLGQPGKSSRPTAPDAQRQRSGNARPGRPDRRSSSARPVAQAAPPVIAETVVVAPPPPKPRRPSPFATRAFRQTLFPPALVCGLGLAGLGLAYFLAPADAATRQWPPTAAAGVIAVGAACLATAGLLAVTLRR